MRRRVVWAVNIGYVKGHWIWTGEPNETDGLHIGLHKRTPFLGLGMGGQISSL